MKRGCFDNLFFIFVLFVAFGASTYFWFNFFIKGKSLSTPDLVGKSVAEARAICSDLGIELFVDPSARRNSDRVPAGNIAWQNRSPGAANFIKRGTTIRVGLSEGPLVLRVPDLAGKSAGTAVLRLGQVNLKLGNFAYVGGGGPPGVLAADPPQGAVVAAQTPVSLLVSTAPHPPAYVMPDLIDKPLEEVRPLLEIRELRISTVRFEAYPGIRDGTIIRQYPPRGAPVSSRDPITVVVSRQEETAIVEEPPPPRPLLSTTTTQ
ncbi:MAG TPA: PASTA domain-containing protein [Thermoanaerobaculia bacterium]|nr:PASTA domain-containing protein [Thermoanaerobaculia bacterium]